MNSATHFIKFQNNVTYYTCLVVFCGYSRTNQQPPLSFCFFTFNVKLSQIKFALFYVYRWVHTHYFLKIKTLVIGIFLMIGF